MAHEGASEIELALDGDALGLEGLRRDLSEHDLLGEVLRADGQPPLAPAPGQGQKGERRERGEKTFHVPGPQRRSAAESAASQRRARAAAGIAPARIRR